MKTKVEIQSWLAKRIGSEINIAVEKIDQRKPFVEYGIDSAAAVGVVADLEDFLGCALDPNLFYAYPTIQELGEYLESAIQEQAAPDAKAS